MKFCTCGKLIHEVKMQDGRRVAVEVFPIPYCESEQGTMRLITLDGRMVQAVSSPYAMRQGVGYTPHCCPKRERP